MVTRLKRNRELLILVLIFVLLGFSVFSLLENQNGVVPYRFFGGAQ